MIRASILGILGVTFSLGACGDDGDTAQPRQQCEGVDCGDHGLCNAEGGEAVCLCDKGWVADGLACVPDTCGGFSCVHGQCDDAGSDPVCVCDAGYAGVACDSCAPGYELQEGACAAVSPCNAITFSYVAPAASSVWLTGTMTTPEWAPRDIAGAIAMSDDGSGTWTTTLTLPEGARELYKFIVDGTEWVHDPLNPLTEDDGFGGTNSVIEVCGLCGDLEAFDWRDTVMYFAMTDRFYDSDGISFPVERATGDNGFGISGQYEGGDLNGVTQKMAYLADLGVSALWLTAPFDNRELAGRGINDPFNYAAYHGYWPSPEDIDYSDPLNPTPTPQVEDRIGSAEDLHQLIAAAHDATSANGFGIKVLVDYVMNHVDAESGLAKAHPDWFTVDDDGGIPLCEPNDWWDHEYWGTRCAFTDYLPALDMWQDEVRAWSVNDALWWAREFGFDGYRLDAIKHVPLSWLTELRERLDAELPDAPGGRFYLIGETFDYFDRDLLKSFVDPDTMLDGQFDFPFKFEACNALFGDVDLDVFAQWTRGNDDFYQVDGASKRSLMGTWIGNHDVPRAIHFASRQIEVCSQGSDNSNGWTMSYTQPSDAEPYERLGLAFAVMLTGPGVPLIYYGDEIGLAGGGDPDNRRLMPWDDAQLNAHQLALRDRVRALARLRGRMKALSRGRRTTLSADADTWVYRMGGCDDPGAAPEVVVAINRSDEAAEVTLPAGSYSDLLEGSSVEAGVLSLPPRGFRVMEVQ